MKYVMFAKRTDGMTLMHPIIFPTMLVHSDIVDALTKPGAPLEGFTPTGAGELSLFDVPEVGGQSTTLDHLCPGEDDLMIIRFNDYGGGFR